MGGIKKGIHHFLKRLPPNTMRGGVVCAVRKVKIVTQLVWMDGWIKLFHCLNTSSYSQAQITMKIQVFFKSIQTFLFNNSS